MSFASTSRRDFRVPRRTRLPLGSLVVGWRAARTTCEEPASSRHRAGASMAKFDFYAEDRRAPRPAPRPTPAARGRGPTPFSSVSRATRRRSRPTRAPARSPRGPARRAAGGPMIQSSKCQNLSGPSARESSGRLGGSAESDTCQKWRGGRLYRAIRADTKADKCFLVSYDR